MPGAADRHRRGAEGHFSSPGELEPVLRHMLENATRLCEAKFGNCFFAKERAFRTVAIHNAPPAFAEQRRREPLIRSRTGDPLAASSQPSRAVHIC